MTAQAAQPAPVLKLSTQDLPNHHRLSAMRDYLYETSRYELSVLDSDVPLQYAASFRVVPGANWGTVSSTVIASTRTAQLVKDGHDDLLLVVPFARISVETPTEGDLRIEPGHAVLFSQAREMRLVLKETGSIWALRVTPSHNSTNGAPAWLRADHGHPTGHADAVTAPELWPAA